MRTKILYLVLLFIGITSYAQQDAQYTQYMYNTININPAYAGSRGVLSVFGLYRTQWVGLDGAPKTAAFSVNSPIENSNLGVGLSVVTDQIGPTNEHAISADISYSIPTSETYKLSFGLKGTANLFNVDRDKLVAFDNTDSSIQGISNDFSPNIGAGVYFHSDKLYLGVSAPNFLETKRIGETLDGTKLTLYKERMNFYGIAGYVFDLNANLKFKPAVLTKIVQGAPLQVDVSGNFLINEKFVLGAAWRWDAAVSALAGFQINKGLYLGYAYDRETTKLANYNSGSHEIFLRFELFSKPEKIVSPRFF
jgi:type IX secretion system PorP/SprF family membrane protein